MVQLNKLECKRLWSWGRDKPRQRMYHVRLVLTHEGERCRELETVKVKDLAALRAALPSNKLTSPVLASVRRKFKQAIEAQGGVQPHQEPPGAWPKVYRMKSAGGGGGLLKTGGGQWVKMSEEVLMHPLAMTHRWNQVFGGDLVIMGTRNEVAAAIQAAGGRMICESNYGDIFKNDASHQFDRMYGNDDFDSAEDARQSTVVLSVEVVPGITMEETEDEFEVVLNPRGEVVNQVGSGLTGIAGGIGPGMGNEVLEIISEVKSGIEDHAIPILEKVASAKRHRDEARAQKSRMSVIIAAGARGRNSRQMGTRFDGTALHAAVVALMANL